MTLATFGDIRYPSGSENRPGFFLRDTGKGGIMEEPNP